MTAISLDRAKAVNIDSSENPLDDGCVPNQEWFVSKILTRTKGLVLDCGCGRGLWSRRIKELNVDVTGLDFSLRRLKRCVAEKNNDRIVRASCTHLPFKSACFDTVTLIEVIEHLEKNRQLTAMDETSRVLRTGGQLIMTTPNRIIYSILTKFAFKHNPEHVHELTCGEALSLVRKRFRLVSIDGKFFPGRVAWLEILDRLLPTFLAWDLLIIGEKAG